MTLKVYLTKSSEVANLLAHAFASDMREGVNGVTGVSNGSADNKDVVPAIYHNKGYFYCAAECENLDGSEPPPNTN